MKLSPILRALGACRPAIRWARAFERENPGATMAMAWVACPDGEWIMWLLLKIRRRAEGNERDALRAIHLRAFVALWGAQRTREAPAVRAAIGWGGWQTVRAVLERAAEGT